jgi:hypothetical protein
MTRFSLLAVLTGAALVLAGCSQLSQTGQAMADNHGSLMDGSERPLGQRRYQITVKGSTLLFEGKAEQFFRQRADDLSRRLGCKGWQLQSYRSGIDDTLLGARRYAEGVIVCL